MTEPNEVAGIINYLTNKLGSDYEILGWKEMLPELVQAIEVDNIGGIIMLVILYIVIGFGIFGTILMMTIERRHEFGIMLAIGLKRFRLIQLVTMESLLLSLLGVLAGMVISLPLVTYFHFNPIPLSNEMQQMAESYGMEAILPFSLAPQIFFYQAVAVVIIAIIALAYPLFRIFILRPTEAMRS